MTPSPEFQRETLASIEARLSSIEAEVVEQDHRALVVLRRFLIDRRKWPADDPRRAAATRALIWSLFFSPATIAVGGAVIGICSIAVLIWQNLLINDQILRQDRLAVEERRSNAIRLIFEDQYAKHPQIRAQALRELATLAFESENNERLAVERRFFTEVGLGRDENLGFNAGQRQSDGEIGATFYRTLKGIHLDQPNLAGIVITNLNLNNATFVGANLNGARFVFTSLRSSRFVENSTLRDALIASSDLGHASFSSACAPNIDLSGSDLHQVDFSGADLRGARWQGVKNWRTAQFEGAIIAGARGASEEMLEHFRHERAIMEIDQARSTPCGRLSPGQNPAR
jgi:uncharacterized protein YjbI with pentapeptide repeats